jgi:non-homologous end joining protein Ku
VEAPPKVVNLMDALRKSLDSISGSKKKPALIEMNERKLPGAVSKKRARA